MNNIFLNITIHLQQSQKASLQLFFFNLWINYCSHLRGVRNITALRTFAFLTTPQPNTHFLETTILFLKQSNCSQSKIKLVIKVRGIFKFLRTCVCNCSPFKLLDERYWLFNPKQCKNVQMNHSGRKMHEQQAWRQGGFPCRF